MTVARILFWNLADSKTSLAEVREHLPSSTADVIWLANEPQERLGLVAVADAVPDLDRLRTLIGKDPEVAEEFDVL